MRRTLSLLLLLAFASSVAADDRPNVIVILADDQRAQDLGIAGHPIVKTPNIDKLAQRGTYFTQAFVTTAACMPSRTSILTGQYERKHGVTFESGTALSQEAVAMTYPMMLKAAGYYTGYIGKNHTPAKGMEEAFDYWYAADAHLTFYPKTRYKIFRNAKADTQVEILDEAATRFLNPKEAMLTGPGGVRRHRPKDQPFCLLVNFNVPHGVGTNSMRMLPADPALYRTTYRSLEDRMPIPATYVAAADIQTPRLPPEVYNGQYIKQYDYVKTPAALREHMVRECQTITGIDQLVGHVINELKKQGIEDNTIIVYFSDHGIQNGEFGLGGKVFLYEPSIRVPFIIHDPRLKGAQRAGRVDKMALSIDIAPTLLDLCGVKPPEGIQGRSLAPLMRGETVDWRSDFFLENMFMGQNYPRMEGVRNERFKYIRYFDKKLDKPNPIAINASIRGEKPIYEELFDLKSDPHERTNLAGDTRFAATRDEMRLRCQRLVAELRDQRKPSGQIEPASR